MIKLKYKEDFSNWYMDYYLEDVEAIVAKFASKGYEISSTEACKVWEAYSDSFCAGWLIGAKNISEEEFDILLSFTQEF